MVLLPRPDNFFQEFAHKPWGRQNCVFGRGNSTVGSKAFFIGSGAMIANAKARQVPAAIYMRASTKKQDKSVADQRREIASYAKKHGYRVVREYIDDGISGNAKRRPGFERLMHDVLAVRDFEVILCWKRDRFSRADDLKATDAWRTLRSAQIAIVSVTQGPLDLDSFGGRLQAAVEQHGYHEFLINLSQGVARGFKSRSRDGKWIGRPPFGYTMGANGRLTPDPATCEFVRLAFRWFVEEKPSLQEIARRLQAADVGPRKWKQTYVLHMLRNEAYIGHLIWGRKPCGQYARVINGDIVPVSEGDQYRRSRQSDANCIVVRNAHEAIIDEKTWKRTKDALSRRQCSRRRPKSHLLTGLAFCGHCGAPLCGARHHRPDGVAYARYSCQSRFGVSHKQECKFCLNSAELHDIVISHVTNRFLREDQIERMRAGAVAYIERKRIRQGKTSEAMQRAVDQATADVERAEGRLSKVPDDMLAALCQQIAGLKQRRDRLTAELLVENRLAKMTNKALACEAADLVTQLRSLREAVCSDDSAAAHAALDRLLKRIVVYTEPAPPSGKNRRLTRIEFIYRPDLPHAATVSDSLSGHCIDVSDSYEVERSQKATYTRV